MALKMLFEVDCILLEEGAPQFHLKALSTSQVTCPELHTPPTAVHQDTQALAQLSME